MKSVKALVASIAIVSLMAMLVGTAVMGATVTATVTAANIAISVSSGTIAYGTVLTSQDTVTLGQTQTVTNDGNVAEDFSVAGTDSADWTLGATAGSATYRHDFCAGTSCTPSTPLTTTDQSLATSVAAAGTQDVNFKITVPTSNAGTAQENVNVSITASAS